VYIIVGVIFFFGVVLGFKLVYDFIGTSSEMRLAEFQTRIKADAESASMKEGSVRKYLYTVPYQTDQVCFYDKSAGSGTLPNDPALRAMIEENKNVFIVSGDKLRGISVPRLKTPAMYYCVNASDNNIEVTLAGKAGSALVRKL
jgi:hypothetical protein